MRGTLEELGGDRWRLRVFAGREAGKVRHVNHNFRGTKRQAQTALAKLVTEVEQQEITAAGAGQLGELLDRWLEYIGPHRAAYTMDEYRRLVEKTIKPALGKVRLDKLTGRQLDAFYRSLQERGLSGSSIHQHHSILHASLGRAVKWGMLATNPADRATAPRPARSTVTAPAVPDVQKLIAAAEADGDHVLATAIALGAVTGARRGELCALRWSDVDLELGILEVSRSVVVVVGGLAEKTTKTDRSRKVSLDPVGIALLTAHRAHVEQWITEASSELEPDAFVFSPSVRAATPFRPDNVTSFFIRVRDAVGAPDVRLHDLRHFTATQLIGAGMDVRTVADFLGHSDPSLTLRVYSHAIEERNKAAAAIMGQVLSAQRKPAELTPAG